MAIREEDELWDKIEIAEFLMHTVSEAGVDLTVNFTKAVCAIGEDVETWLCGCIRFGGIVEDFEECAYGNTPLEAVNNFIKKYSRSLK